MKGDRTMKIQIVGAGCQRCNETEMNVINACAKLNLAADISHVWDVKEHAKLGVRSIPAVIVNGKIVISGRVPTIVELEKLFLKEMQ
jgi:small redox-active disulfide protein 2